MFFTDALTTYYSEATSQTLELLKSEHIISTRDIDRNSPTTCMRHYDAFIDSQETVIPPG